MTWQPPAVEWPDVELWLTTWLRSALSARPEAFAQGVHVSNRRPSTNRPRAVVVRRDGGFVRSLIDEARVTVRVFADDEDEASDLALLVRSLILTAPGSGPCAWSSVSSGPLGVADDSQFQKYLGTEIGLRPVRDL